LQNTENIYLLHCIKYLQVARECPPARHCRPIVVAVVGVATAIVVAVIVFTVVITVAVVVVAVVSATAAIAIAIVAFAVVMVASSC